MTTRDPSEDPAAIPVCLSPLEEEAWRDVVRPLANTRLDLVDSTALPLATKCHEHVPELGPRNFETTLASAVSGVDDMTRRMLEGHDPAEYQCAAPASEFARQVARNGLPVDMLFRVSHAAHSFLLRDWLGGLTEQRTKQRELASAAADYCERFLVTWFNALDRSWATEYTAERERWVGSFEAVRADTARAILAGRGPDPATASRRLRYELGRVHRAFFLWSDASDVDVESLLVRRGMLIAEAIGGEDRLVLCLDRSSARSSVCGWVSNPGVLQLDELRVILKAGDTPAMRVALGTPHAGVEGFRRSHREALEAHRVAQLSRRGGGTIHEYHALALTALATADLDQAREFVRRELGPLANQDDPTVRIASTLKIYFEELGSAARTARRVGIHKNTVVYRIQQAEHLLGRKLDERSLELQMALALARVVAEADASEAGITSPD